MDGQALVLIAMALAAALLLFCGGLILFGRYAGHQQGQGSRCWMRTSPDGTWLPGRLRYDHDRLDFHGSGGLSLRARHRWQRSALELGMAKAADPAEFPGGPAGGLVSVSGCYGEHEFELTLGRQHYTALRSWVESNPPGWNANVA